MFAEDDARMTPRGLWTDGATDDDSTSTSDVIRRLIHAVGNDHHAPDIIPYPTQLVDAVSECIVRQGRIAAELIEEEKAAAALQEFSYLPFKRSDIIKIEIQRIQFLLCELLRSRIRKIEKLAFAIVSAGESSDSTSGGNMSPGAASSQRAGNPYTDILSPNEMLIAHRLAGLRHACMLNSGLRHVPDPLQMLVPNLPHGEGQEILPVVDLGKHVFVFILQDIGHVVELAPGLNETLTKGEIFLVPYKALQSLVLDGKARLM